MVVAFRVFSGSNRLLGVCNASQIVMVLGAILFLYFPIISGAQHTHGAVSRKITVLLS